MQKIILILFYFFFSIKYSYAKDEYFELKNDKVNLRQGPSF